VTEIAALDRNPFNDVPFDSPRVIYAISLCRAALR
jgi:hypothetical protein